MRGSRRLRSASHGDPGCWVHRWHVECRGHAGTPCRHAALKAALEDAAATAFGSSQHVLVMPHHEQQRRPTRHRKNYRESPDTLQTRSFIIRTRSLSHTPAGVGERRDQQSNKNNQRNKALEAGHPYPTELRKAAPPPSSTRRNGASATDGRQSGTKNGKQQQRATAGRGRGGGG